MGTSEAEISRVFSFSTMHLEAAYAAELPLRILFSANFCSFKRSTGGSYGRYGISMGLRLPDEQTGRWAGGQGGCRRLSWFFSGVCEVHPATSTQRSRLAGISEQYPQPSCPCFKEQKALKPKHASNGGGKRQGLLQKAAQ
jgi:hypothetical protein